MSDMDTEYFSTLLPDWAWHGHDPNTVCKFLSTPRGPGSGMTGIIPGRSNSINLIMKHVSSDDPSRQARLPHILRTITVDYRKPDLINLLNLAMSPQASHVREIRYRVPVLLRTGIHDRAVFNILYDQWHDYEDDRVRRIAGIPNPRLSLDYIHRKVTKVAKNQTAIAEVAADFIVWEIALSKFPKLTSITLSFEMMDFGPSLRGYVVLRDKLLFDTLDRSSDRHARVLISGLSIAREAGIHIKSFNLRGLPTGPDPFFPKRAPSDRTNTEALSDSTNSEALSDSTNSEALSDSTNSEALSDSTNAEALSDSTNAEAHAFFRDLAYSGLSGLEMIWRPKSQVWNEWESEHEFHMDKTIPCSILQKSWQTLETIVLADEGHPYLDMYLLRDVLAGEPALPNLRSLTIKGMMIFPKTFFLLVQSAPNLKALQLERVLFYRDSFVEEDSDDEDSYRYSYSPIRAQLMKICEIIGQWHKFFRVKVSRIQFYEGKEKPRKVMVPNSYTNYDARFERFLRDILLREMTAPFAMWQFRLYVGFRKLRKIGDIP